MCNTELTKANIRNYRMGYCELMKYLLNIVN